jgi:hypothetical protein
MSFDWPVFLFGLLIFVVGSLGILLLYAGAAVEEAEHERGTLARLTLWICRAVGITKDSSEEKAQKQLRKGG